MKTSVDLSVGLLRKFADFTKKLSPEQLEAVVAGTLKFVIIEASAPKASGLTVDVEQLSAELGGMTSRDAAVQRLEDLKLTAQLMKELAKALGAPIAGVRKRDAIRDRIVEHTVGFRLNSETIRHGSWSS